MHLTVGNKKIRNIKGMLGCENICNRLWKTEHN
jgi:hypothetical protein